VTKYYAKSLFTEEELDLLKPTHHFGPKLDLDEIGKQNQKLLENGCCRRWFNNRNYREAGMEIEMPCVRTDAVDIERRYNINGQLSENGQEDSWSFTGWVHLNFRTPFKKRLFLNHCVNRVLVEYNELILKNVCTACGRLKRTPKAIQCMWCL
jgi:hypothetical protein